MSIVVKPVTVERLFVLRPGGGRIETFTPAATGAIRITALVGASNCRVTATLHDAGGHMLAEYRDRPLRELELTATTTIDPDHLARFTVRLENPGTVEGAGTLRLEFIGREVTDELPLTKLNHLAGVVAVNEIHPRIVMTADEFALQVDERFDDHVPTQLKHIKRSFKKVVTFHVEALRLGSELRVEFVAASATYPTGSVRVTATVDHVRISALGVPLGGADHGRVLIEVGVGSAHGRVAVTRIDVSIEWQGAGVLYLVDLRDFAAQKLDEVLEAQARAKVAALITATTWIKTLMQLDEFLDLRITATALTVRGIGGPVAPTMPSGPITTAPSGRLQHLVVVMMENRSFDHMLGDLLAGRPQLGSLPQYREEYDHRVYRLQAATTAKVLDDPPHGSGPQRTQAAGKFVQAYVESHLTHGSSPGEVLTFQPEAHVPFFRFLVDQACVCRDWRAAIPGQTWPNRNYALSGTSHGVLDNGSGGFDFYDFPAIADVLHARRPDQWRYFKSDVAFLELYRRWFRDDHHIRRVREFHDECAAGTLRRVTWIEPNISDFGSERGSDDHPPADLKYGQGFLSEVYRSLAAYTAQSGDHDWLLLITYDEHGGFYDSQGIGPKVSDDHAATAQRGFRVPAFLMSPWLPPSVCTAPLDHASIVRTILDRFCGPGTSMDSIKRVQDATGFADVLDVAVDEHWPSPRLAPITPPPFARLPAEFFPPPPPAGQESTLADQLDRAEIDVDGIGATSDLWRAFIARKREALRGGGVVGAGRGGSEVGLDDEARVAPTTRPAPALPLDGVRLEGLAIDYPGGELPVGFDPAHDAPGWTVVALASHPTQRLLVPPRDTTVTGGWAVAYALQAKLADVAVDPLWEVFGTRAADVEVATDGHGELNWHLDAVRAGSAWQLPSPSGRTAGDGVVVAHLDTGFTEHPDLQGLFSTGLDRDLLDGHDQPTDPLDWLPGWFPGHGTATASLLASRPDDPGRLIGTAPRATLIEYRISRSVVHLSMRRMIEAITLAVAAGAHVISISAGGLWSPRLHRAVRRATDAGVVVVAAAGNYSAWTVWPARFPEVIACGACDHDLRRWRWTSGRDPIDVYAPGAGVWVANAGDPATLVRRGNGTSFAAAVTAGAVATWLSFHGRDRLLARFGRAGLAAAARTALVASAARSAMGSAVLDLHALLEQALPDVDPRSYFGRLESTTDVIEDPAPELPTGVAAPSPAVAAELGFFTQLGQLRGGDWRALAETHGSPQLKAALG